jgi:hypothetical protein
MGPPRFCQSAFSAAQRISQITQSIGQAQDYAVVAIEFDAMIEAAIQTCNLKAEQSQESHFHNRKDRGA